jgi:hypothetical protein
MKLYNPEQIQQIVDNYLFADPKPSGKLIDYINEQTEVESTIVGNTLYCGSQVYLVADLEAENLNEPQKQQLNIGAAISRLKSIRRFNLANYREGEFGIDTEREYDCNGDYIDSYEIDEVISELENGLN